MKRRVFALCAILPIILAMVVFAPGARAEESPDSLVEVISCVKTGSGDISSAGSSATFTVTVEFPKLADSSNAEYSDLSADQLEALEVTMGPGSGFSLRSGAMVVRPFTGKNFATIPPADSVVYGRSTATFTLDLTYTGRSNDLVLTLKHPTMTGSPAVAEVATSTWSFFVKETIAAPPIDIPQPDPPDYGATPYLSLTGSLPNLEAGKSGSIRFSLTNSSQHVAYGVNVSILEGAEGLFRPTTISGSIISVGTIRVGNSNSASVTIPVEVFDDVKEGYYTIPLRLTMTNTAGSSVEQISSIQVFIKNPNSGESAGTPSLSLASATVNKNTPGSDGLITLTLAIANIGDGTAADARISLTGFRSSEITLDESLVTKPLGDIASGARPTVTYSLKVAADLESGSYPLGVEVKYKLPDGTEGILTDVAYINIIRPAATQSNVQLTGISQDLSNPGTANIIRVTLNIQNKGSTAAQDVSVGFTGLSSSSFTLSGDFGERKLGNIAAGGTTSTTIPLYVSESLPNGNYPLSFFIRYTDTGASGAQGNLAETEVYIFVNRPEKPGEGPGEDVDNSVPRVIISRHAVSVDNVVAGSPFELSVTLLNTSTKKNIKNLKITVTDKDGIFIPVEGVNSFYVAEIPIGQTTDISIILMPKQDAETKSYPVSISLDYEDERDISYTVTESLSIPVYLPQRLEVMNVMFNEDGMGTAFLSFQIIDKGKAPLYNMNIRIDGPMNAMEGDYYIGTFGPGQSDYFEDTIYPQVYGEVSGDIVLEFEDSSGTQQEVRYPLFAFISEPYWPDPGFSEEGMWPMDPNFPFEGEFGEDGGWFKTWMIWAIAGAVVVIAVVTIIIIVKTTKKKKAELNDYE